MMESADRAARNEEVFRRVNERIDEGAERHHVASVLPFHCECSATTCVETLQIAPADYERVAGRPYFFVLIPGHENPEVERVVEEHESYLVVEKVGEARAQIDRDRAGDGEGEGEKA